MSGKLTPGARLPSVRDLAAQAKVNPNTIQKALVELEKLGLVYTERTNGKFVTYDIELIRASRQGFADQLVAGYLHGMKNLGFDTSTAIKYLKSTGDRSGTTKIR